MLRAAPSRSAAARRAANAPSAARPPAPFCARAATAAAALAAPKAASPAPGLRPSNPNNNTRPRRLPSPPASTSAPAESVCYTGTVTWDNDASEDCTVLAIDATDYDGLLRVIAWVLYGLQLRIRAAVLRSTTAEEEAAVGAAALAGGEGETSALGRALSGLGGGFGGGGGGGGSVTDVFWVTDRRGRKLTDRSADGVAERLQEFISTCAPDEDAGARFEAGLQGWECSGGGVHATNGAHPQYTQLTVTADDYSPGLVLEVTSVIAGMGMAVREAVVRSGGLRATLGGPGGNGNGSNGDNGGGNGPASSGKPAPPPSPPLGMEPGVAAGITRALETLPEPPPGKRVLRFWLYDRAKAGAGGGTGGGGKLSFPQVQALLYCIGLATGRGNLSTTPPTKTITGCACSPEPPVLATAPAAGGRRGAAAGGATTTVGWTTGGEESS